MNNNHNINGDIKKPASYRYDKELPADSAMLEELLKATDIQQLFESYYNLITIPVAVIDLNANVLLSSRWQRICTQFHRVHPTTCGRCIESDTQLATQLKEGLTYTIYACRNGLTDCASPIIIEGKHIANLFIGQFLTKEPDEAWFRRQAEEFGFDIADYLAALHEVPIVEEQKIPAILDLLARMTHVITNLGIDRKRAIESQARQSIILDTIPQAVFWKDTHGRYLGCNAPFARAAGLTTPDDIVGKTDFDLPWPRQEAEAYRADDMAIIAANERRLHIIEPLQQADGLRLVVDTSKIPLVDAGNTPYGVVGIYEDITERKRTEDVLRKTETYRRMLFESARDAIIILKNERFVDCNPSALALFGADRQSFIGHMPYEFSPPYQPDGRLSKDSALKKIGVALNGSPQFFDWKHQRLDGTLFDAEVSLNRVDFSEEEVFLQAIVRDVSERKRADEALHESEERFRTLSDHSLVGIYNIQDNRFIYVNSAFAEIFGYQPDELIGASPLVVIHPDDQAMVAEQIRRRVAGEVPAMQYEFRGRRKNGETRHIEVFSAQIILNNRPAIVGNLLDITERKRAEEKLKKAAEEWQTTFNSTTDLFFLIDKDYRITKVNKAVSTFLKLPIEKIVGRYCYELMHETTTPMPECPLSKLRRSMQHEDAELYLKAQNIWVQVTVDPVLDEKGELLGVVHIVRDITERKRAAEELARLYQQVKEEAEVSASLLNLVEMLNTSLDERELIKNVLNQAPRYLKFDRIGIFLYDESARGFVFSGGHGYSPVEESILLSRNFGAGDFPAMEKAVRGETLIIENAQETDLINKELVDTFSIKGAVIVPISARGKVTGGIYGDYKTKRPIERKDVTFLKGLADGIAIALQNSRLYRESVERMMELSGKIETIKTMAMLDREILSTIDKVTILKTAVTLVSRIIPCERAAVLFKEGDNFRVISEWGVGRFLDNVYSVKKIHFDALGRQSSSLFIPDLASDNADCVYHREQDGIGIRSSLLVPLVTKGERIGLLDIGSTFHGRLAPTHLSIAENIGAQITVALENARLYEELQQLLISTITSLASAIDAKSPWTKGHSERVTQYALQIGQEMGLKDEELERLKLSGLLHDVGKIGTYDILLDKSAKLTDEEFELVKKHPGKGAEILGPIKQLSDIIPGVRHHHERYDGKGYPDGLKGEEIPLQARILCVADSFDSMTADRPYRPAPGKGYAISEFKRCLGTQFDPNVVAAFLRISEGINL